jgi:hypothetical protein
MKFQFSIARFLMATAMVALTFGLARMLLDKKISSFAILITAIAADLGLLVLVAQKKSDIFRVLRVVAIVLCCFSANAVLVCFVNLIQNPSKTVLIWFLIILSTGLLMGFLSIFLGKMIKKAEGKAHEHEVERDDK